MVNSLKDIMSSCVTRSIYYVYFHAHVRYGAIFWGGNPESKGIFKLQKRMIRLISNVRRYTSCRELFKALNTLPAPCLYTSEIVCYIKTNIDRLELNTDIHDHNTRQN
jgi:hypothetical protein